MNTTIHTLESAPEAAKPLLESSNKAFGMIPNLHGVMAESPELLKGYQTITQLFQSSDFSNEELTVVWQTINVYHQCHYCVPGHTAIAKSMKVDDAITARIREHAPLDDPKLQVLREVTEHILESRGHLSEELWARFSEVGYSDKHLLQIVLGISHKVMSNYTNSLYETPVDDAFKMFE
ncbi:carboxymuconolactone decarboxylase family protein [Marinibactrum halimedae]|uniref:Carboxymuconolactone decarboxylase family protein n=2 Tax=Marinibactrum halimedae TaxID=1444977 RepID=A0AA37T2U6_9GAMM|nr:carboxymuconolactone decarboxylase family protein [Marinibactrum halimedae]MCD9458685.1 carboxymuconolactone decarboxylase family protein [Marinibactrum halimedae]GLS25949.1 hypothetical protein GCM10007877_16640 [Marinibactrum halimedae]